MRARIVLACAEGVSNKQVAETFWVTEAMVGRWRRRFVELRLAGLLDQPRGARSVASDAGQVAAVVGETVRLAVSGDGRAALPGDPPLPDDEYEVVGLYVNPPDHAVVLCAVGGSEVSTSPEQLSAVPVGTHVDGVHERAEGRVMAGPRVDERVFDAPDLRTGVLIPVAHGVHRAREFRRFLGRVDAEIPDPLAVHVLAGYTGGQAAVSSWMTRRPRFHLHRADGDLGWSEQLRAWFGAVDAEMILSDMHRASDLPGGICGWIVQRSERSGQPWPSRLDPRPPVPIARGGELAGAAGEDPAWPSGPSDAEVAAAVDQLSRFGGHGVDGAGREYTALVTPWDGHWQVFVLDPRDGLLGSLDVKSPAQADHATRLFLSRELGVCADCVVVTVQQN